MPSIVQLHDPTTGMPTLKPERANTIEAGADWQQGPLALHGTVFHTKLRDLIRRDDFTDRMGNLDCARMRGVELSASWQASRQLWLQPAYTFLDAKDCSSGAMFDKLTYRPKHKLSADLRWQASAAVAFGASMVHVRDQVHESRSGPPRQAELPSYTLVNLNAHWRLKQWQLSAFVDNAFDRDYSTSYGFPQAGRTVSVRATMDF